MKTFASTLLIAAVAFARDLPETDAEVIEADAEYWTEVSNYTAYGKNLWLGVFQGLYGMSSKVERPDDGCFGEWIPEHMEELYEFRTHSGGNLMLVDMDEAKQNAISSEGICRPQPHRRAQWRHRSVRIMSASA